MTQSVQFDSTQAELIAIHSGKHFVSAPPGAGKTALLTARLKMATEHFADSDIACLTFTVRAALEMQHRAEHVLVERQPFIGNFHAYCMELLRKTGHPNFRHLRFATLLPEDYCKELVELAVASTKNTAPDYTDVPEVMFELCDAQSIASSNVYQPSWSKVMRGAYTALALLTRPESVAQAIGRAMLAPKMNQYVADICRITGITFGNYEHAIILLYRVFEGYAKQKRSSNAIDFDDLLVHGFALLLHESKTMRFVQVDEVQDLNPLQWAILDTLSDETTHVFAVGDELQSIYAFLGADVAHLQARTKTFTTHRLVNNYRAQPPLVDILNAYREQHWQLPSIQAQQPTTDPASTLLIGAANLADEVDMAMRGISQILADPTRNIGMLLPTNKLIDSYCARFLSMGLDFFRVSENDLMQQVALQDAFSTLRIINGSGQRVDWWSLVYRLTRTGAGSRYTRKHIISMINDFAHKRLPFELVLLGETEVLKYPYQYLQQAGETGVVIFDTETTGLDFMSDKIIQLAAVKVVNGEIVAEFDEYVSIEFGAHCEDTNSSDLERAFLESQHIHHITLEQVHNGDTWPNVLARFIDFVGDCPLLAHNLKYDVEMLKSNSTGLEMYGSLEHDLYTMLHRPCFDTLKLSRVLLPKQSSYRLEALLDAFGLEGVNSHNALDDVKATASLFNLLMEYLPKHLVTADALLDQYADVIKPFRHAWQQLSHELLRPQYFSSALSLSKLIDGYLDYASNQDHWYQPDTLANVQQQARRKLYPWLDKHALEGILSHLIDMNVYANARKAMDQQKALMVGQLGTLKETDLIDPERDKLVVSTVHRAKGLEFDTVYLPCCVANQYPRWMPDNLPQVEREAAIAESIRLLYVALSRPKNKLIVSYHQFDGRYNQRLTDFLANCVAHFAYQR
jgi:DNA helicase-2/ATP-dependent DNA helicase PcrA